MQPLTFWPYVQTGIKLVSQLSVVWAHTTLFTENLCELTIWSSGTRVGERPYFGHCNAPIFLDTYGKNKMYWRSAVSKIRWFLYFQFKSPIFILLLSDVQICTSLRVAPKRFLFLHKNCQTMSWIDFIVMQLIQLFFLQVCSHQVFAATFV